MTKKIAFIGCGNWAQQTYLPFFKNNSETELVALSGLSKSADDGQAIAEKLGFKTYYKSWQEMLEKEKIDVAIITTPHAHHFEQIKMCLEKGVHVHVDKPPVLHAEEVRTLLDLAKKNSLIVSVHTQRRFYTEYQYVRDILAQNGLGQIQFVGCDFGQELFSDFHGSWRSNPDLAGGGIMTDSGYHIIDSVMYMLNQPAVKEVVMLSNNGPFQADTFATLSVQLEDQTVVTFNVIRGLPKGMSQEKIQFVGEKGYITISREGKNGAKTLKMSHYDLSGKLIKEMDDPTGKVDRVIPLRNFFASLDGKEELLSPLSQAKVTIEVIEAGYDSVKKNELISLSN